MRLLLISASSCSLHSSNFFHINHLNPHATVIAEGLCPAGILAVTSQKAPSSSGSSPAKQQAEHTADAHHPSLLCFPGVCAHSPPRLGWTVRQAQAAPIYCGDAARPPWHSSPPSPPPPGSSTWIQSPRQLGQLRGQRRNVGNESLTGSGLGVRQRFTAHLPLLQILSHPSHPLRAVSPFPMAQLLLGAAKDLRLQVHKDTAAPRTATPLYFMPWSLSCRIWLVLYHPTGLAAGARTSRGTGMPSARSTAPFRLQNPPHPFSSTLQRKQSKTSLL